MTLAMAAAGAAALGSGMMGGLLFAFSNFVMKSIARQAPEYGIRTMQAINADIQNPLFLLLFFGTAIASLIVVATGIAGRSASGSWVPISGGALYLVGVIGVTMRLNVPLNNQLAVLDPSASDAAARWQAFLTSWMLWNHVRALAAVLACVLLILAIRQFAVAAS
jgi:uncharacterized membrane protein